MKFTLFCTPLLMLGALVLVFSGCYTVPETQRHSLQLLPESQEMQLGFSEFEKMKKEVPISHDPISNALLQKVGNRIADAANLPKGQREFVVFESKEANAFCLPGGKVGVYTGILPITLDEAGLATVLGHEVAHAIARHGGERISRAMVTEAVGSLLAAGTQESKYAYFINQAYGLGSSVSVELPHSRLQESEADHNGLLYMARAGYPPEAAVNFWKRFAEFNKQAGSSTPWFLRTHPLDETRIQQIEKWLPEARTQFRSQK